MSSPLDEQAARVAGLLLRADDIALVDIRWLGGAGAWLIRRGSERLVLKHGRPEQDEADVTWEHDHLRRLALDGFPASVPVPAFDGQSWTRLDDRIWAALSYLPGRPLVTERTPDFEAAGAFLAGYHGAARSLPRPERRPTEPGLSPLRAVTPLDRLDAALGDARSFDRYMELLDDLEAGLHSLGYDRLEQLVIHGDPTNDNLIVDGTPPRVVGLIDFGSSHLAPWPADLAAALWRSGRPDPDVVEYDPDRIRRFVAGYHRESPLPPALAHAIPLLMQGRGLQLISRSVRRRPPGQPIAPSAHVLLSLRRAAWVHDHRQDLLAAVATALHTSWRSEAE